MSDQPEAFYLPADDDVYEPTRATESPWDRDAQHGGPPTALLAHTIDATVAPGMRMARISVDFLAPIPRRRARIEVTPLRPGRQVRLTEAHMIVDGRVAVTARAWHIATGPTPPAQTEQVAPPPLPPARAEQDYFHGLTDWGYGQAIEWRYTQGGYDTLGRAQAWTRVRLPLIAGQKLTGLARTLIVADSANGLSATLPLQQWLSIPPTMTTTLLRHPDGDWVHLDCRTDLSDDGLGLTHATLSDPDGQLGTVAQPLLVRRR
ncbi:thioesterase family protein [Actinoallomurus purpureus]|uniref:thioesterase family protein n=1 Tax=Actinoallomurus purpureus TaxID=478114 RepID=UPI0020933F6D|nr:thioesterase family protein [Actinoallomurus purpureus]MCO6004671.1 thioesterase family protein [Actinoallomurus purpureus]